jgi:hypothetical protein
MEVILGWGLLQALHLSNRQATLPFKWTKGRCSGAQLRHRRASKGHSNKPRYSGLNLVLLLQKPNLPIS